MRIPGSLAMIFFSVALSLPAPLLAADPPPAAFSPEKLKADVARLASEEMMGRGVGTAGITLAEQHIAAAFEEAGLEPLGDSGGYRQEFEVTIGVERGGTTRLVLPGGRIVTPGAEFQPLSLSGSGEASGAAVVFAGYGITAPELHHDDYDGIDATGKLVLVLAHDPRELDSKSPFRAPAAFRYTEARYKAITAREHGAAGILVINDSWRHPGEDPGPVAFDGGHAVSSAGLPAGSISTAIADLLLAPSSRTAEELGRAIDESGTSRSLEVTGASATLAVELRPIRGRAANVVGLLRGADPELSKEAVVLGAHHDHLGLGGVYSLSPASRGKVHHGADDNASGTAGVLALARHFANPSRRPARSLVFATFSAEELGLLGSNHYVKHPPFPLENTYAMVNMDMVGRLTDGKVTVQGVDSARELRELVSKAAEGLDLRVSYSGDGYGPSDQTSFFAKGRPVLFFFTGPHTDYHRPTDTADKVDPDGIARVLDLVSAATRTLANRPEPLTFVPSSDPAAGVAASSGGGGGYGPYFGSIPDFSEHEGGVLLSGVRGGSPAEQAGVRGGDVIVEFGGTKIANLHDLTYALRSHRPGDVVKVKLERGGETLEVEAKLTKRK